MLRTTPTGRVLLILCFAVVFLATSGTNHLHAAKPNVILVMADDLGIGDVSPTNPDCKINTPHLQKMADEGLTFFDAHTPSSVCTPTRYGLLTGRYNWRSRLARGVLSGTSDHLIPPDRPTLGHLMRKAGYHTAMIGKWHLGWDWHKDGKEIDFTKPVLNGPDINGFDQYYAHCGSLDMPPYVWVDTGRVTAPPDRVEGVTKKQDRYGWYRKGPIGSDFKIDEVLPHLFDKSMDLVKSQAEQARAGKPFFLYLALPAPHTPIVPVPPFKDASGMNPYADFVMQVDYHMGQLLATVRESGLDDNTLVIFTSDNGCSPEANFPLLEELGHDPSGKYRGHKADIYEGGHRVPFIVRWPGEIEANRKTDALACLTDIYATLSNITGQERETSGGEDGYSLLPVFKGAATSGRDTLVSHSIGGSFAIRQGPWKLCLSRGSGGWSAPREAAARKQGLPPMQLFNLAEDVGETNNLVDDEPDKVEHLLALLEEQVKNGRCTPGEPLKNDRDVEYLPNHSAESPAATSNLRVLAYNVKHGRGNDGKVDLERTARVIRGLNPDVVALQEIDNKATRSAKVDEAKRLGELTGLRHHAFGRFMDFQGGEYGMAIISRYPLSDVTNLRLPDGAEPRTSLIAVVQAPQPFRLANVHFYATEQERLAQARTLLEFLDKRPDIPCVIAGDFNSQPDSPVLKLFSDWHIPDKGDDHFTFSSDKPRIEIDFILHRPDTAFVVREIDVVDEPIASDHRPLIVDLFVVPERPARWWKGNLHTHSLWSDGNDFPEMIADWYRQRGYNFLALSDHNVLSKGLRWMKLSAIESRNGKTALPKYLARFGKDWVETRGNRSDGTFEVRLKPLAEFRTLVESAGEFLMIQSEEITDKGAHINATNIAEVIQPQGGESVRETIQNNLRAIDEQAKRLGRTIIPHLNHPNLGDKGISAEDLAALVQDEFFEVFNGVDQDGDLGSDRRHSLETLWDITSTLRISEFGAAPMFALATDDSHEYHGRTRLSPGRGWIMLRAKFLSPESIVGAMQRGDFYASSGVILNNVEFDKANKAFHIEIEPDGDAEFTTQFIGTPVSFDKTTTQRKDKEGNAVEGTLDYSADVGKVFATEKGHKVSYQMTGDELYVRATITSSKAPESPTSESPFKKAWTQPVGWRARLGE